MKKKENKNTYCMKCEHRWRQRGKKKPKKCPRCNNPNWDKRKAKDLANLILG